MDGDSKQAAAAEPGQAQNSGSVSATGYPEVPRFIHSIDPTIWNDPSMIHELAIPNEIQMTTYIGYIIHGYQDYKGRTLWSLLQEETTEWSDYHWKAMTTIAATHLRTLFVARGVYIHAGGSIRGNIRNAL